ncbi:MAG: TauD/TfdA family dioxygenase [Pseudomonadota bacterium]
MRHYARIRVNPLTPKLGAEVGGVNLAELDDQTFAELKSAFLDHLVLVFRDQDLTREQHKDFGRRFGQLQTHPAKTHLGLPGDPEIFDIKITAKTKVANGESWHTDLSCEPVPPMASALYITTTPEGGGGDTLFANMYEAFETLSHPIKKLLEGLTAFHNGFKDLKAYGYEAKPGDTYPCASHPVVPIHPETQKPLLFVNEPFTESINELTPGESDAILDMLYRHIEVNTRFHARVRWEANTVVLWDNRCAHHHAVWDYYPHTRLGERVTVKCEQPPGRG